MKLNFLYRFLQLSILASGTLPVLTEDLQAAKIDVVGLPPVTTLREIVSFESHSKELPGSIVIGKKSDLYISFPFLNEIRRYSQKGDFLDSYCLPIEPENLSSGIAIKWNQDIYVIVNSFFACNNDANGVWEITKKGRIRKFADIPFGGYPSSMVFDKNDHLYVSDSVRGKIWKIDHNGNTCSWFNDAMLHGNPHGALMSGIPMGASGIVMGKKNKHLFVANSDYGRIIKVKIKQDGSPGEASIYVEDKALIGVRSISINRRGILYATIPDQNTILGIHKKSIEVISQDSPLEYPYGLAMKKHKGINLGFFTNGALIDQNNPGIFRFKVACDPLHAD